ncbi:hypothetical protein TNIN_81061 [Trichonephila inaurata madagascariensis]|uniref:Uncharacterized protein n=1 Tax=Trichonephila inaurata madagascariensis TaxID=2747483 RepID=A0A8X7BYY0_9ARAC|nr:hypothetical protein TNIN_81061 [Trichonephila inaurata madagascariensis]
MLDNQSVSLQNRRSSVGMEGRSESTAASAERSLWGRRSIGVWCWNSRSIDSVDPMYEVGVEGLRVDTN